MTEEEQEHCDTCGARVGPERLHETDVLTRGKVKICPYCYNSLRLTDPTMQSICHLMNILEDRIVERLKA